MAHWTTRTGDNLQKKEKEKEKMHSTTLTAVALQDHLIRSLSLKDPVLSFKKQQTKKPIRQKVEKSAKSGTQKEYVLDPKPLPLTLAQKLGLVEAPVQPLSEHEWQGVKDKSNKREDFREPCVVCKEDFGTMEQVLLSCSHVFHRACLEAFERFTGKKTCPMCRSSNYQRRVIHEGAKYHRHKCATCIQSAWRGHVVRSWYRRLRETVPPNDPELRRQFYMKKLEEVTERMVQSFNCDVDGFLGEIENSLQQSRLVFRQFDDVTKVMTDEEWANIQQKAMARRELDCPICLTVLQSSQLTSTLEPQTSWHFDGKRANQRPNISGADKSSATKKKLMKTANSADPSVAGAAANPAGRTRQSVLLSCSHVFHSTCLQALEQFATGDTGTVCPVCRSYYQKRLI